MLQLGFSSSLKNISHDPEKSKKRVKEAWSKSSTSLRKEIQRLCGVSSQTIYRAYNSGKVSANIIIVMAQVLKIDPLYLIGKNDKARTYSEEIVAQFIAELENSMSEKARKSAEKRLAKKDASLVVNNETDLTTAKVNETPPEDNMRPEEPENVSIEHMTEKEAGRLLRNLFTQAKYNDNKKAQLLQIKELLVK